MWRSSALLVTVLSISCSCSACGGRAKTSPANAAPDAGTKLKWAFGGGAQDVVDVVQDRAGKLYVAVNVTESRTLRSVVVALDSEGRELWRVELPDKAVETVMSNGAGEVWARGTSAVSRILTSGELRWSTPLAGGFARGALGPDGSSL